jgi:hypothetical protein
MVSLGLSIQLVSAAIGLGLVLAHVDHPLSIFVPMGVLAYGQGLTLPGVTATAVSLTQENVGVASSMIGFLPQLLGARPPGMGHFPTTPRCRWFSAQPLPARLPALRCAELHVVRRSSAHFCWRFSRARRLAVDGHFGQHPRMMPITPQIQSLCMSSPPPGP